MAYVLGFWFADGSMKHDRSYRIRFHSINLEHLQIIRKTLNSNSPIVREHRNGILKNTFELCIHSKKAYFDIQTLGGTQNKSKTLKFPPVPFKLLPDFIRGYFDGDGSVHFIRYKHSKNGKFYTNIRSNFTCGSKPFLRRIRDHLTKALGVNKRKLCGYGKPPTRWKLGYGEKDTKKILEYIYYPNHRISLQRKNAFLQHFI